MYKKYPRIICIFSNFLGNLDSSEEENSTEIQLSGGFATNPFLQSITLSSVDSNPFLSLHGNKSEKPNIFMQENNSSNTAILISNPFLNFGTDTRVDIETSDAPEPVTQAPYRPLPSAPVINTLPSSHTPAPVNNPFILSPIHNPPIKVEPPSSGISSLPNIVPIRIDSTKTKSEQSK